MVSRTTLSLTEEDRVFLDENNIKISQTMRDALQILRETDTKNITAALCKLQIKNGVDKK